MNIKEKIGSRITECRKAMNITIKELAHRTGELSPARISNWEQGTRSPGPLEARMLADVLEVNAAYLLCLTDHHQGELKLQDKVTPRFVPLLSLEQTSMSKQALKKIIQETNILSDGHQKICLDATTANIAGSNSFAIIVNDTSMKPEFNVRDIVIVDPERTPNPGEYVIAKLNKQNQTMLRKYRECDSDKPGNHHYQLIALNDDWGTIQVIDNKEATLLATVIEHRRYMGLG